MRSARKLHESVTVNLRANLNSRQREEMNRIHRYIIHNLSEFNIIRGAIYRIILCAWRDFTVEAYQQYAREGRIWTHAISHLRDNTFVNRLENLPDMNLTFVILEGWLNRVSFFHNLWTLEKQHNLVRYAFSHEIEKD